MPRPLNALAALVISGLTLTACATTPEPCTAEWAQWKTEKVLKRFAFQNRGLVNDLRKLSNAEKISPMQALSLAAKADDFQKFADTFQTTIIPELEAAVGECGSDKLVPAFTEFLRGEGVSEDALELVEPILGLMQAMRDDSAA